MRQFLRDNWEEFTCGFVLGLGFFWAISYWCLLLALICGCAWRLGGSIEKSFRRIGVPVSIVIALGFTWFNVLAGLATHGLLRIGYGTKTIYSDDPGSPYGNFMERLFGRYGKIVSRATIIVGIWTIWGLAWVLS